MYSFPEYWLYWTYTLPGLLSVPLSSAEGRRVVVLEPGDQAQGEGPDFTDALLEIDGVRQRGDVEIHIDALD